MHFYQKPLFTHTTALLLLALLFILHLQVGPSQLSVFKAIQDSIANTESIDNLVLFGIRLPRLLTAILVGATLGMAGAALQSLLRNPLAGPGLIGVSNCAALGAVIAIYFGLSNFLWFAVPLAGMIGACLSVILIFMLSGKNSSTTTLILAGVAVNALASSCISLALNFSPNPYAMSEIVIWLLGSIANKSLAEVYLAAPFMLLGWAFILSSGRFLNALSLGEKTAISLGFDLNLHRSLLVIGVALSVGAAVSVSGSIGFIGLVVPHLLRPIVKYEPSRLLSISAYGGAIMLVLADIAVQVISPTQELKLGVITALVGGPFFLYLIVRTRNTMP